MIGISLGGTDGLSARVFDRSRPIAVCPRIAKAPQKCALYGVNPDVRQK